MLVDEKRSIFALLEDREPIWVVNNTKEPSCLVALSFGREVKFPPLPPGPDPICLTEQIPHKALANSYDFRQAVQKRLLRLITNDSALDYFEKNAGRKAAIKDKLKKLMEFPTSGITTMEKEGSVSNVAVDARDTLMPKVLSLHAAFSNQSISEEALLEDLITLENDLGDNDLEFIRSLNSPAVKRFVESVTKQRRDAIVAEAEKEKAAAVMENETEKAEAPPVNRTTRSADEDDFPIDDD
jgi:hypothetical protein